MTRPTTQRGEGEIWGKKKKKGASMLSQETRQKEKLVRLLSARIERLPGKESLGEQ